MESGKNQEESLENTKKRYMYVYYGVAKGCCVTCDCPKISNVTCDCDQISCMMQDMTS